MYIVKLENELREKTSTIDQLDGELRVMETDRKQLLNTVQELKVRFVSSFIYSSDGRVTRAYFSGALDLDWIPSLVKPVTVKLMFTASSLDAQH